MKKIFALLLVFVMVFALAACGGNTDTPSKDDGDITDVSSAVGGVDDGEINFDEQEDIDTSSEEEKKLELKEDIEYAVVALTKKNITISSTDDFANYTCAYIGDCDSEVWANYYDFKEIGLYNMTNDLHSGLGGNNYQLGIVSKMGVSAYSDWEIVWELKAE